MECRKLALSLLLLVVIVSGCADNEGKVSGEAIAVQGPTVEPTEIFEGSSVRVSMAVENTGEIAGTIITEDAHRRNTITDEEAVEQLKDSKNQDQTENTDTGEQAIKGRRIMTDYCSDFFSIPEDGFSAYSSRNSEIAPYYELKPGETVQMNWELKQEGGNVPLNGYPCSIKFQVPFNYSVQAYQQIQVKSRNSETDVKLSSKTSQGPLSIAIETIGSSSKTGAPIFLEEDNPEALIQIVNDQPEESVFRGVIRAKDLEIASSGIELGERCSDFEKPIKIDQNHMSDIIRCDITGTGLDGSPSKRAEITAAANYTYVKNVGSRNVKVKYSGN